MNRLKGARVGNFAEGFFEGRLEGTLVGGLDGFVEGLLDGLLLGRLDGLDIITCVGRFEGILVGRRGRIVGCLKVGLDVGITVGLAVGKTVGVAVGFGRSHTGFSGYRRRRPFHDLEFRFPVSKHTE